MFSILLLVKPTVCNFPFYGLSFEKQNRNPLEQLYQIDLVFKIFLIIINSYFFLIKS